MSSEYSVGKFVGDLITASKTEQWNIVDKLVPWFQGLVRKGKADGNTAVKSLLLFLDDPNPHIRDGAATAIEVVDIPNRSLLAEVISKARKGALLDEGDEGKFAMGRSAALLFKYRQDPDFGPEIGKILGEFVAQVQGRGWADELEENILPLKGLFHPV